MLSLEKGVNDTKTEISELIEKGYDLIIYLRNLDLIYKKIKSVH